MDANFYPFFQFYQFVQLQYGLIVQSALSVACYVLFSYGLYTIAKNRRIHNKWMAWFPLLRLWVLGCISDQYRYITKNQTKKKRIWLIVLRGIRDVALAVFVVLLVMLMGYAIARGMWELPMADHDALDGLVLGLLISLAVFSGFAIASAIVKFTALFDLYLSCAPDNATTFLVLSIIFSVLTPFFVFFNRNKNLGMPEKFFDSGDAPGLPDSDGEM